MYSPFSIHELIKQAETGTIPPSGSLEDADEVLGFAFDAILDDKGGLSEPGRVNESIADFIINNEIIRSKRMTLQEELAVAVIARDGDLEGQIEVLSTIKKPGKTYDTHELMLIAKDGFRKRNSGRLAILAFRYHMPRAAAVVEKAGFKVVVPNMGGVGSFNSESSLPWTQSEQNWIKRERKVIPYFALRNWI